MKKAIVYCRISRDPEHNELGVRRQERDCRELCERVGLSIVDVVVDDDRSAYSGKKRPGYERVLEAVRRGEVSAVVAWHPDRLTRSPRELETLIDTLEAAKATVTTVQAGEYDLATPSGRMTARVVGAVARGESEHKSARLRRKHLELAEQGKSSGGGTRPFGYKSDMVTIEKAEAKLIREAVAAVIAGASIRSIAARWNAQGLVSTRGKPWSPMTTQRVLRSARIAGLREHQSGTYNAIWPAIISADDHRRIRAILDDPARRKNTRPTRYLLTGFAQCGLCSARLVARPRGDKQRCYVCSTGPGFHGCGKIRQLSEPLEADVVEAVLLRFEGPSLEAVMDDHHDDHDDLAELATIETRLAELAEMWANGELDRVSWSAARRPLEASVDTISARIAGRSATATAGRYVGTGGALRASWPDLSFDERRAVLATVIEAVVVGPAVKGRNFYDPTRVTIRWRA